MPKDESAAKAKSQLDKFREAARELETDQSEEAFDRLVKKIAKPKPEDKAKKGQRDS
ncbi:hypothetical protein [Mesorhizobium sp.]|uniref:hypothetical protein n=1 Tax=Mesorhizobium sp. TaxID=1871066 RepID=UPI00257B2CD8|nr:hypothetical protein [Mesorhizobium sp.]